jgi:hypothetical protein
MELNLKINVDWIDEDYNLDDTIREQIIDNLTSTIRSGIKDNIKRKVNQRVSVLVDEWIMAQLMSFCDRRISITDKWGDTTEHHESVTEMFKEKFDNFFNATVDKNGKTLTSCGYGSSRLTRIDHMLNVKADEYLANITKSMDSKIKAALNKSEQERIQKTIEKHVIAKVSSLAEVTLGK